MGERLVIDLPIGSAITNLNTGRKINLIKEGETALILKGGNGGYGNGAFQSFN